MLANLRRKIGMTTPGMQPDPPNPIDVSGVVYDANLAGMGAGVLDEMAFVWPADSMFSPTNIPLWLQEASLTDLGLPINGSDGVFLPFGPGWTGLGEMGMPEAW
ncbi:hypothetical protein FRC12_025007 [Ceratobasidium sp. 428]|nr:hypothetical protein FRC12_025007 [Ceratobasidium sp. 428]